MIALIVFSIPDFFKKMKKVRTFEEALITYKNEIKNVIVVVFDSISITL